MSFAESSFFPVLPGGLDLSKVTSLGLKLVSNLAVRPLRGTMELANGLGTEFVFRFPLPARPKEGKLASMPAPAHRVPEPVETT